MPAEVRAQPDQNGGGVPLSRREREVLGLAAAGLLDKQIAVELGLSPNTLRTYWTRIRSKLGELPRAALVASHVKGEIQLQESDHGSVTHEGWILDVRTMTVVASDSINDLHGLERNAPHSADEYSRLYHPEDRDATRAALFDVIEGRIDSAHLVFRIALKSGIELVNLSVHSTRDENGNVTRVYGYRARSLDCRQDHDPSVRVGRWERLLPESEVWIDDELAAIVGREHSGIYDISVVEDHILPEDIGAFVKEVEDSIQTGQSIVERDGKFRRADGTIHWCRVSRQIVRQDDGRFKVYGTLSVFR